MSDREDGYVSLEETEVEQVLLEGKTSKKKDKLEPNYTAISRCILEVNGKKLFQCKQTKLVCEKAYLFGQFAFIDGIAAATFVLNQKLNPSSVEEKLKKIVKDHFCSSGDIISLPKDLTILGRNDISDFVYSKGKIYEKLYNPDLECYVSAEEVYKKAEEIKKKATKNKTRPVFYVYLVSCDKDEKVKTHRIGSDGKIYNSKGEQTDSDGFEVLQLKSNKPTDKKSEKKNSKNVVYIPLSEDEDEENEIVKTVFGKKTTGSCLILSTSAIHELPQDSQEGEEKPTDELTTPNISDSNEIDHLLKEKYQCFVASLGYEEAKRLVSENMSKKKEKETEGEKRPTKKRKLSV